MEDDKVIHVSRLYSITDYAKKNNIQYNTVLNWIGRRKLESVFISSSQFVVESENKEEVK